MEICTWTQGAGQLTIASKHMAKKRPPLDKAKAALERAGYVVKQKRLTVLHSFHVERSVYLEFMACVKQARGKRGKLSISQAVSEALALWVASNKHR